MLKFFLLFCRKHFLFCSLSILFLGAGLLIFIGQERRGIPLSSVRIQIGGQVYHVEVADTYAKRAKGLGERDTLCGDCGMLFVFDAPGEYAFWMKDMRFPIDIIWLKDNKIVHIEKDVHPDSLDILNPGVSANSVLELNANESENFSPLDEIQFLERKG